MSSTVRLDYAAFRAFRRDALTKAAINSEAEKMAARANSAATANHAGQPDYGVATAIDSDHGAIALVSTGNTAARVDQAVHNTLLKAVPS